MKRLFAIIMLALTVLSVGGLAAYSVHKSMASGGLPPEIHFDKERIEVETTATDAELLKGVTATDQEDGDVTASLVVERISHLVEDSTVNVTYVAFDSQNHVTRASREVCYTNYTSPRFTLTKPLLFTTQTVSDLMKCIGAKDCIDGDLSLKVHASFDDAVSVLSEPGVHDVELTVTNSLGDTVRVTVPVRVADDMPHSENIPLKTYLVYVEQGSSFDPKAYLSNLDTAAADDEADGVHISSNVNTGTPGSYAVDYTLTKNDAVTASTRLIVVVEGKGA